MMSPQNTKNLQNLFVLLLAFVLAGCASTAQDPVDDEVVEVVVELSSGPRPEPAGVMVVKSSSPASFCSVTDSEVAGVGPSDELIGVAEGSGVVPDPVGEVGVVGSLEVTSGWVVGGVLGWTSSWLSDPGLGRARRGAAQRPRTKRTGIRNVSFILIWRSINEIKVRKCRYVGTSDTSMCFERLSS